MQRQQTPCGLGGQLAWAAAAGLAIYIPGFSEITALLLPLVVMGIIVTVRPRRLVVQAQNRRLLWQ
jgi:hypothetical protein